tara:strand:- start:880 stop:1650 length:771 start_codon:yes stop_codon:yes gene_type:complete
MKRIESKIIAEIGLNHLGKEELLTKLIDKVIESGFKYLTIQIREIEYYKEGDRKKYILDANFVEKELKRAQVSNIKVGLAIADKNFKKMSAHFNADFYKVLSWKANDIGLIDYLLEYRKPIYLSLGMLSSDEIFDLNNRLLNRESKVNFIHTQLNYNINDLNLRFITKLQEQTKFKISYGHHTKNNLDPIVMSLAYDIDKIFLYVKLNDNNLYLDDEHALNLDMAKDTIFKLNNCIQLLGNDTKNSSINFIDTLED